jgi:hypothetical protein
MPGLLPFKIKTAQDFPYTGQRRLAEKPSQLSSRRKNESFWLLRLMGVLIATIYIQLADHLAAQLAFWQHALNRIFNN